MHCCHDGNRYSGLGLRFGRRIVGILGGDGVRLAGSTGVRRNRRRVGFVHASDLVSGRSADSPLHRRDKATSPAAK